ncbi:MAG: hypothetical protein K0R90_716 [Oscillospiraceae bacterium]|nr:hypothetical protein [Oscillospiraceae bacterium]
MPKKDGNTVSIVTALAKPITDELGLALWDVRFEKEGSSWFLRIIIDKEEGISFDDCEAVSRAVGKLLDETDPIDQSYYLEVSSPGLGRALKKAWHFESSVGQEVKVRLIRPINDVREVFGILKDFKDNKITIQNETGEHQFEINECAYVKLDDDSDIGFSD